MYLRGGKGRREGVGVSVALRSRVVRLRALTELIKSARDEASTPAGDQIGNYPKRLRGKGWFDVGGNVIG
jgi:hypothetical protein